MNPIDNSAENDNIYKVFQIVAIIIFLGLVTAGIILIYKSNSIYTDSLGYLEKAIKIDTTLKGRITALPNYTIIKDGYSQALLYFTLALAIILLAILIPRLQTFSISPTGGINVTLKELQREVNDIKTQNNDIQSNSTDIGGGKINPNAKLEEISIQAKEKELSARTICDDPQKGKWGEMPESNGRKLTAQVTKTTIATLYRVDLTVKSTDANKPLTGLVKFHLHPTFANSDPIIAVNDGIAKLTLKWVYGSFTVGAEVDNGDTTLELDLAKLPDVPKEFRDI